MFGFGDEEPFGFGDEPMTADASGAAAGAFDFSDLDAALESSMAAAAAAGPTRHAASTAPQVQQEQGAGTCVGPAVGPLLPEFYLYAEEEPGSRWWWCPWGPTQGGWKEGKRTSSYISV